MADSSTPSARPRLVEGGGGPGWFEQNNGQPRASYRNARVALTCLGCVFSINEFKQRAFVNWHLFGSADVEISDRRLTALRMAIADRYGFDPGDKHLRSAVDALCETRCYDPIKEYLAGLKWDGTRRLDTWLMKFMGVDDTPLAQEMGRKTLIAGVRRVRQPGCKFDHILVLEGPQRAGKSTSLAVLAGSPDVFTDQEMIKLDAKGQQEAIAGKWIIELAELSGLRRAEVEHVKAFISRQYERGRPAYGHFSLDQPRRCIMIGTTNAREYLSDPTGNTRFWPVKIGHIDLAGLEAARDQLWAEAAAAEANGETLIMDRELWPDAAREQLRRVEGHPWDDLVKDVEFHMHSHPDGMQHRVWTSAVFSHLGILKEKQGTAFAQQVARSMRLSGWEGPDKIRIDGKTGSARGFWRFVPDACGTEDDSI